MYKIYLEFLDINLKKYKILPILATAIFFWSLYQLFIFRNLFIGDSEIHLIFAKNFINGHFLEFNPGIKSGGESSFLYFIIVSFLYKLFGIYAAYGMKIISIFSAFWICFQIFDINASKNFFRKIIGASLIACSASFTFQATSGMENIFFCSILLYFISPELKSNLALKNKNVLIKSIILFLIRPEGLLYPFFLLLKSLIIKNKKLFIFSLLAFLSCILVYFLLSIISGGNFHNAGEIRKYISTIPNIGIYLINIFGYQLNINTTLFRSIIYALPILLLLLLFRNTFNKSEYLIFIVFVSIPFFLHFFSFLPNVHFTRYFIYSYSIIFLLFAKKLIPNLSPLFLSFITFLYLFVSINRGLTNTFKFYDCDFSDNLCQSTVQQTISLASSRNIKEFSDNMYNEFSKTKNQVVNVGATEVNLRLLLDNRFNVWPLDGITDRDLSKFAKKDHIDHFGYLNYREIDVVEDLPNLNKNNQFHSLSDLYTLLDTDKISKSCIQNNQDFRTNKCRLDQNIPIKSICLKNKRVVKSNIKTRALNIAGFNGGWFWKVENCKV